MKYLALVTLFVSGMVSAAPCSAPSDTVTRLMSPVMDARYQKGDSEHEILALAATPGAAAAEALVRLSYMSLGSWPGTLLTCSIEERSQDTVAFLEDPAICLNEADFPAGYVRDWKRDMTFRANLARAERIRRGVIHSCDFD